jgi:hypothetical protein
MTFRKLFQQTGPKDEYTLCIGNTQYFFQRHFCVFPTIVNIQTAVITFVQCRVVSGLRSTFNHEIRI